MCGLVCPGGAKWRAVHDHPVCRFMRRSHEQGRSSVEILMELAVGGLTVARGEKGNNQEFLAPPPAGAEGQIHKGNSAQLILISHSVSLIVYLQKRLLLFMPSRISIFMLKYTKN